VFGQRRLLFASIFEYSPWQFYAKSGDIWAAISSGLVNAKSPMLRER